jgi:hypothetical protein
VKKVGYIRYGNVDETLRRLNRGIRSGGIITLTGQGGVGKSQMLGQLVLEEPRIFEPDQIALVQMVQPNRRLFGKDRIASPPAMVFFSRLWYVIQKMSRLTYKEWLETLDQKPARHYTDGDFLGLHANIAEAVEQRHIALVLGDNIEDIDGLTFDWLIQLWNDCQQQFAIVLCAQMKPNATPDEPFKDLWSHVSREMREYHVDELVLNQMSKESFVEVVLPALLDDLNADYDSSVALSGLLWQRTQGNWHSLTRLITFLNEELAQDKHSPRIITPDVAKRVFERR